MISEKVCDNLSCSYSGHCGRSKGLVLITFFKKVEIVSSLNGLFPGEISLDLDPLGFLAKMERLTQKSQALSGFATCHRAPVFCTNDNCDIIPICGTNILIVGKTINQGFRVNVGNTATENLRVPPGSFLSTASLFERSGKHLKETFSRRCSSYNPPYPECYPIGSS